MGALAIQQTSMESTLAFAAELAKAELLPKPYQRKPAMILMAMEMAKDLGCSVVSVMNGTYEIGGRLAYYTDFMLAQARRMGVLRSVAYESVGEGPKLVVTARALMGTGEVVESSVGMAEAQAEGWTKNPKYRSMPEQMLRKRAIKRLISNHCPEVMLGASAEDDEEFVAGAESATPVRVSPAPAASIARLTSKLPLAKSEPTPTFVTESQPAEDPTPEPEPQSQLAEDTALRAAQIQTTLAEAGVETEVVALGAVVPFDQKVKEHRALVTEVFNEHGVPGRWRTLHKEKLEAHLATVPDLMATLESVREALEPYFAAHPWEVAK